MRASSVCMGYIYYKRPYYNISCGLTVFIRHRHLIQQLVLREIFSRYRGSTLGLAWMMLSPLLLLIMFSFVFSHLFPARWGIIDTAATPVVLILFSGIILHQFMADCLMQTPSVVVEHPNFVKRVIFPIDILVPVKILANAGVFLFQWTVLLLTLVLVAGDFYWMGMLWLPLVFLPFVLLITGIGWIFASVGLFFRDLRQVMSMLIMMLLFMSPVLYPSSIFPEVVRPYLHLNPLTFALEELRNLLLWGHSPAWAGIGIYWLSSFTVALMGYVFFTFTRKGFADVI